MASLQSLLASNDQSVRLKAALAAGTYPDPSYIELLVTQCSHEPDFFVRDTLSWALMRHDITAVVERLKPELISSNPQAKSQALHTLTKIGDKKNYSLVTLEHLFDSNDQVALTAWRTASVLAPESEQLPLAKILVAQLGRGNSEVQFDLTRFLCALGDCILDLLAEAAKSPKEEVRMHAEFTAVRYQEMKLEKEKRTVGGEGFEPPTSSV
jgi:HEAT repeat protein